MVKIKYGKVNRKVGYGEPDHRETAWKILIAIIILSAAVIVLSHYGIKI